MCGIVGIVGNGPVASRLVEALKRLEYRGYDSAGVATLEGGAIVRRRAEGKLARLAERLSADPLAGSIGIGHTRWATHGPATERNAHPHVYGGVAVVHNGIIENHRTLKEALAARGHSFETDTDTEVIAHLVAEAVGEGLDPASAVARALPQLSGAFALALLFEGHDDLIIVARRGSPLAVGYGRSETYVGSDAIALAPFTDAVTYLEDGDWAVLTRSGASIRDATGHEVVRPVQRSLASALLVDKGNHRHFMAKEIHEQPEVVGHTLAHYLDLAAGRVRLPDLPVDLPAIGRLSMAACGTAYYAGLVGKYWFERLAGIGVEIDIASEFRYREVPLEPGGLALFISQSGETADTLAALRHCRDAGQAIAAIVNVQESSIAREADVVLPTLAGPEIGVASTKAFTCQLAVLACLAAAGGVARGRIDRDGEHALVDALAGAPRLMTEALKAEAEIEALARDLARARDVLYLGRGQAYPLALEGALKLKEISYIHAEGYAAGELKHGPIALIDEDLPVIVVAPFDELFEKTLSNVQEVAARGGNIILVTDERGAEACDVATYRTIVLPSAPSLVAPLVYALPMQLIAYHTAVFMGTDVDQPRNLAKSVTVE